MRLDKFLKVSRIIKRRSVASDACDIGRVELNGKVAKPSKIVKAGDVLEIAFGDKTFKVRVEKLPQGNIGKEQAESLYSVVAEADND